MILGVPTLTETICIIAVSSMTRHAIKSPAMNRRSFALLAVGLAHHSISGVYDSRRRMTLEGVVTEFQFVNPHPFVVIESTNRDGQSEQWKLEMDNRHELADLGFT